jgi:RND family efflux transporter MFP subunit
MSFDQNALDSLRIERTPEPEHDGSRPAYKWIIVAVLALAVVAGLYVWLRDGAIEVQAATAIAANGGAGSRGPAVLNASGYVVARRQATVSAKTTGRIAEVLIEEGMEVEEGQVLATLDDSTVRPQLALAERQLEAARKELEEVAVRAEEAARNVARLEKLRADNLVSESQLDAAQSEYKALAARLEALKSNVKVAESSLRVRQQELADLIIRSPFDGVVVSKDAQPGEMVSPISAGGGYTRTGIATIVDMSSREIEVDVNEAFINRVKPGQKTVAVLDAYPDWQIPSHVINIVPTADRQKATVRVRIGFDELEPRILPDMGVKVSFLDDSSAQTGNAPRPAVRVPASSVFREGQTAYVWRISDDRVERIAVSVGAERNGQIDVLSGINAGDVVVAQPVEGLADGAPVKIKEG